MKRILILFLVITGVVIYGADKESICNYKKDNKKITIVTNMFEEVMAEKIPDFYQLNFGSFGKENIIIFDKNILILFDKGVPVILSDKNIKIENLYDKIKNEYKIEIDKITSEIGEESFIKDINRDILLVINCDYDGFLSSEITDLSTKKKFTVDIELKNVIKKDNFIYAISEKGTIITVDEKNDKIKYYSILLEKNSIVDVLNKENTFYVTSEKGVFCSISKYGNIKILSQPDENIRYTNIADIGNDIFTGVNYFDGGNYLIGSELAVYNTKSRMQKRVKINKFKGIIRVENLINKLLIIGNQIENYEGGSYSEDGGVAVYDNNKIFYFEETLGKRVNYIGDSKIEVMDNGEEGENIKVVTYKIDLINMKLVLLKIENINFEKSLEKKEYKNKKEILHKMVLKKCIVEYQRYCSETD